MIPGMTVMYASPPAALSDSPLWLTVEGVGSFMKSPLVFVELCTWTPLRFLTGEPSGPNRYGCVTRSDAGACSFPGAIATVAENCLIPESMGRRCCVHGIR